MVSKAKEVIIEAEDHAGNRRPLRTFNMTEDYQGPGDLIRAKALARSDLDPGETLVSTPVF